MSLKQQITPKDPSAASCMHKNVTLCLGRARPFLDNRMPFHQMTGVYMTTGKYVEFESKEENLHYEGVYDIDPTELLTKVNDVQLIDCRQHEEYTGELGHIPGAQLIVLDTIPEEINQIPKDRTVVFVCRSGSRSAKASAFLKAQGFQSVYNLKGGMLLWNELHYKTEI